MPGVTISGSVNVCPLCSNFTSEMPRIGIVSPVYVDSFAFDCHMIAPFSLNGLKYVSPISEMDARVSISIAVEMPFNVTSAISGLVDPWPLMWYMHMVYS